MNIDVLDYGYVKYIDHMGTDITPAEAARMSYGAKARGWDEGDGKLIKRLLRDKHTSPFEFNEIVFEIQAPIFVARQMVRHRTANWSEFSMRYADASKVSGQIQYYTPAKWPRGSRSSTSGTEDNDTVLSQRYEHTMREAIACYNDLLVKGATKEQARIVLPTSVYTKWRWKIDFHNLSNFFRLRLADDAQYETREYAKAIYSITEQVWPKLVEASGQV